MRAVFIVLVFACGTTACSRPAVDSRFSAQEAEALAQRFQAALSTADVAALARMARTPFRYKDTKRVWPDAQALQANLAKEVPRVRHLVVGLDRVEVFSIEDLRAGRWPRSREVAEDERDAEIAKLGVERDGWLARVFSEGKVGYTIVMNREGRDLAVQVLDV